MFVVQRFVHATVKRLLGQYVKNNIDSLDDGNGFINLSNLNFKEDVLNKYAHPFGLNILSATLGNVKITSTTSIEWSNIKIHVIKNEQQQQQQPPQTLDDNNDDDIGNESVLGKSLFAMDDDDDDETQIDAEEEGGFFSSFFSPIQGLQKKIEGMTTMIQHTFTHVEINYGDLIVLVTGKYSENDGIKLDSVLISTTQEHFAGMHNVFLNDKHVTCDHMELILSLPVIKILLSLIPPNTDDSAPPLSSVLNTVKASHIIVKLEKRYTMELRGVLIDCIGKKINIDELTIEGYVQMKKAQISLVVATTGQVKATPLSSSDPIEACSPFEEDKIFLFRSQPKPMPIASIAKTSSFITKERNSGKGNIVIKIAELKTFKIPSNEDNTYIRQFIAGLISPPPIPPTPPTTAAYCFEISIQHVFISIDPQINIVINQASCILGRSSFWSAKANSLVVSDILELQQMRIAGDDMKRISGDIRKLEIRNILRLIALVKMIESDPNAEPFDFIIRVKYVSVAPNEYFNEAIVSETVEIFSSTVTPNSIVVTSGRVESQGVSKIRITSCQVSIADMIEVSIASIQGIAAPAVIQQILKNFTDKTNENKNDNNGNNDKYGVIVNPIIMNYANNPRSDDTMPIFPERQCRIKIIVRQARLILQTTGCNTTGHLELLLDQFKIRIFQDSVICFSTEKLECLDRLSLDVWNKALILHKLNMQLDRANGVFGDFQITIGNASANTNSNDDIVTISIDQHVIDFIALYVMECGLIAPQQQPSTTTTTTPAIRSFHVAPFKARIDFKPSASSQNFLRYLPLRGAVIKVKLFDAFDTTPERLAVEFALHTINHVRNLPRIIGGIKPLRAPLSIFRNVTELVLVPFEGAADNGGLQGVINQAQTIVGKIAISVLELGPALNVRRVGTATDAPTSIHSNQPSGVKGGIIQAGQTFTTDMGTVIAFVSGDMRNIDLFDLPLLVLRPLTAPLTDIVNGICNQVDPARYKRMKNKYR